MLVTALEFCELAPALLPPPDPLAALRLRTAMYVRWVCVAIAGDSECFFGSVWMEDGAESNPVLVHSIALGACEAHLAWILSRARHWHILPCLHCHLPPADQEQ